MDNIALYVHWPYCARICPYCDFNIYKNKPDNEQNLIDAILKDMRYWRQLSGPRALTSVHFGGGTPSLLHPKNVQKIIDQAAGLWTFAPQMEIGLEGNPQDITAARLKDWRAAGIERLSLGVQSFDINVLKFLGRDHDGLQARRALEQAAHILPRVSADLIYGWAGQTLQGWRRDLETAFDIGPGHVSAYQLTIEARTAFAKAEQRGQEKAVNSDQSADLYELGLEILSGAGFTQYEVSNFSRTEHDRSRHNLAYWQGSDYAGVGPGAHGRLTSGNVRMATLCALKPKAYMESIAKTRHGLCEQTPLSRMDWGQEYVLMGLRIAQGISLARYQDISGRPLNPQRMEEFIKAGFLKQKNGYLAATSSGRLVLDRLSHELLM